MIYKVLRVFCGNMWWPGGKGEVCGIMFSDTDLYVRVVSSSRIVR